MFVNWGSMLATLLYALFHNSSTAAEELPFIFAEGLVSSKHLSLGRSPWEFLIGLFVEKGMSFGNSLEKHSPTGSFLLTHFCPFVQDFQLQSQASPPSMSKDQRFWV